MKRGKRRNPNYKFSKGRRIRRDSERNNSRSKNRGRSSKGRGGTNIFKWLNSFSRRHPISTGVGLIVVAIIIFRLSFINETLVRSEFIVWAVLFSGLLGLAGFLVLVGWWRNNILNLNTGHTIRFK